MPGIPLAPDAFDAALGSVLGAFVGDSLGSYVEFNPSPSAEKVEKALTMPGGGPHGISPGQLTDDSELAMCLLRGLLEMDAGKFQPEHIAKWYANWMRSSPFDCGSTCRAAFHGGASAGDKASPEAICRAMRKAAQASLPKKANGSLMRCTPLAVFAHRLPLCDVYQVGSADAQLSHPNPTVCVAESAFIAAIGHLINNLGDREGAYQTALALVEQAQQQVGQQKSGDGPAEVLEWLNIARTDTKVPTSPSQGFVKIAFVFAFRHLLLGTDYAQAMRETMLAGGDTDTNCCIVGGLLGASIGASNVPQEWRDTVIGCDTTKKISRERPDFLRPKNVVELVRSLFERAPTTLGA